MVVEQPRCYPSVGGLVVGLQGLAYFIKRCGFYACCKYGFYEVLFGFSRQNGRAHMIRIIGIDPGSRITGYGVIDVDGSRNIHVAHGHIKVEGANLGEKLANIYYRIQQVIEEHQPTEAAIEEVFMSKNAASALKLGQARGAAMCAAAIAGLPVHEYAARLVKQSVVGKGSADKAQIQHMVPLLLNIRGVKLQVDAADGLAIAISHAHLRTSRQLLADLKANS